MKFNKKNFYRTSSATQIIIVLVILIVINVLSALINVRWDMTEGKDFSISATTKKIVKNLDDVVTVKAYFTEDLPGRLISLRQQVEDILAEYVNYSQGNVSVSFIDPASDTTIAQEVNSLGIPMVQFSTVEQDKYQVANGYLGIAVLYGDNKEVIPVVQDTSTLEYELTNAIKRVTSEEELVVAFATGQGELDQEENLQSATQYLAKQYTVQSVDLSTGEAIPDDVKTLIIAQPTTEFTEQALYTIDQFMMGGGSLLVLLDGVTVGNSLQTAVVTTGLEELLSAYGIKVNNDLVLDVSNNMAAFSSGYVQFYVPYPFFVKAVNQFMNQDSVLVNRLESINFPWTSSLENIGGENDGVFALVQTTDQAWTQTSDFDLNPQQQFSVPTEARGQYALALAKFGQFASYWQDRDLPAGNLAADFLANSVASRLIVVGDSDFVVDGFLSSNAENLTFFSNLVDGLTQDLDLVTIRSKTVTDRPLQDISYGWRQTIKYLNIFIPTLAVIIYGFIRSYFRKKETRSDVI